MSSGALIDFLYQKCRREREDVQWNLLNKYQRWCMCSACGLAQRDCGHTGSFEQGQRSCEDSLTGNERQWDTVRCYCELEWHTVQFFFHPAHIFCLKHCISVSCKNCIISQLQFLNRSFSWKRILQLMHIVCNSQCSESIPTQKMRLLNVFKCAQGYNHQSCNVLLALDTFLYTTQSVILTKPAFI